VDSDNDAGYDSKNEEKVVNMHMHADTDTDVVSSINTSTTDILVAHMDVTLQAWTPLCEALSWQQAGWQGA
jgi:hypothetical protein